MACINTRPKCNEADAEIVPEALQEVVGWLGVIWGIVGAAIAAAKFLGTITIVGETIFVGGTAITASFFAGAAAGFVAAVVTFLVVFLSAQDRCTEADTTPECF